MGTRKSVLYAVLIAALTAAISFTATPASAAPGGSTCYKVGAGEFTNFRAQIKAFGQEGKLSPAAVSELTCDPRTASKYITYDVAVEQPAATIYASGCRASGRWTMTFSLGGDLGGHTQSLNWCWDSGNYVVSNWGGECSGYTTGWGTANGWSFQGCVQNDFIPYVLAGHGTGGVHHATNGRFSNTVPWTVDQNLKLDIWGHYDGTCDSKYGSTLRHYC
ncbi:hypothetical protein GCM10010199_43800 [Dactylosporangium roseum]